MKRWEKTVRVLKKVALTAMAFLALTAAFTAQNEAKVVKSAGSPQFNFMQGDYDMLRGAKTTDTAWGDPVSANIGDQVSVMFYYHNGMIDTVAHHTSLRVDIPVENNTTFNLTSYLWSQETQAISNTVVNGAIVGGSGLTINLPSTGRLEYVAGSTKWFPNGSQTGQSVPDAINSVSGLDIGDVQGCWNYAGFVSFLVNVKGQASLVMDKTVAHPGDATWQEEIMASKGDEVAYHLSIRNDGNDTAKLVTVKDLLPTYMTYVPSTTYVYTKSNPAGTKLSDDIFGTGVAIPNMVAGVDGTTYITYKTKIASTIPNDNCGFYLNNVAKVYMNNVEQDQDQAKVTVRCETKKLSINKTVKNGTVWVEQNTVGLGELIEYRVIVKNEGNLALTNVSTRDLLPLYVNYVPGSTKIDGVATNDQLVSTAGINLGTLNPNVSKTITFSGRVYGCPPVGGYTLTNTAYVKADTVVESWDSASTVISVNIPFTPVK
jgi:uncharacterized repeat protein (TIGR01451 family)